MRKLLLVIILTIGLLMFAEEITITAWTVGPDNPSYYRFDNLKTAAERLNKILKDLGVDLTIKVDGYFDTTDWSSFKQKVVFGIKSGQTVDIICSGHDDIGAWAKAGYIIPLDDYVKKYWDEEYYDFIPSLWEATKYKGKIYGIPQDTEARPFYINKQVLKNSAGRMKKSTLCQTGSPGESSPLKTSLKWQKKPLKRVLWSGDSTTDRKQVSTTTSS